MENARRLLLTVLGALLLPVLALGQNNKKPTIEDFLAQLQLDTGTLFFIIFIILFTWGITRLLRLIAKWLAEGPYRPKAQWIWSWLPRLNIFIWALVLFGITKMIFPDDKGAVLAFLASAAIVVGVAAQDLIKNLFGGLWLIAESPFQLKDRIQFGGYYGTVRDISLLRTELVTLDDSAVSVPNSKIFTESIANANDGAPDCMVVIDLWLPHDVDIAKVKKLATEATTTSRYLNFDKPVRLLFSDHYDQRPATKLAIKAYVFDKEFEKIFATEVTETAKKAFQKAGLYPAPPPPKKKN